MEFPDELKGNTLGEKIASELRLRIIDKRIEAGSVISENNVAEEFKTSRSPVREAFKTLSNEGLIRLERMGAVVIGLSKKDIEEIYDVRFLIESFVIDKLAQNDHQHVVNELNKTLDKMQLAAKHLDYVEFTLQDLYFHEHMIESAQHTRILHLWNNIRYVVFTVLLIATKKRFTERPDEIESLIEKHHLLIEAISSKDDEIINKALQENFTDTRSTVFRTV